MSSFSNHYSYILIVPFSFQDGLDQYDRYVEYPRHSDFFASIVRGVVTDTRQTVILNDLELQAVLQDFSTIQ